MQVGHWPKIFFLKIYFKPILCICWLVPNNISLNLYNDNKGTSIYPPTYLPACLPTHLLAYLPTHPSNHPPAHLPTHLPTHPSIYPPAYLPTHLATCLSTYPSIYPATYLQCGGRGRSNSTSVWASSVFLWALGRLCTKAIHFCLLYRLTLISQTGKVDQDKEQCLEDLSFDAWSTAALHMQQSSASPPQVHSIPRNHTGYEQGFHLKLTTWY